MSIPCSCPSLKRCFAILTTRVLLADCDGGYHEKRLLHDLLDTYNILERPVVNESDPLQLSFGLTLMQIIDVVRKTSLCSVEHQLLVLKSKINV